MRISGCAEGHSGVLSWDGGHGRQARPPAYGVGKPSGTHHLSRDTGDGLSRSRGRRENVLATAARCSPTLDARPKSLAKP